MAFGPIGGWRRRVRGIPVRRVVCESMALCNHSRCALPVIIREHEIQKGCLRRVRYATQKVSF
jgi:hypothetical protein